MSKAVEDDAEYWHKRAQATAAKAGASRERNARERLLKIAREYEDVARRAELNASLFE